MCRALSLSSMWGKGCRLENRRLILCSNFLLLPPPNGGLFIYCLILDLLKMKKKNDFLKNELTQLFRHLFFPCLLLPNIRSSFSVTYAYYVQSKQYEWEGNGVKLPGMPYWSKIRQRENFRWYSKEKQGFFPPKQEWKILST